VYAVATLFGAGTILSRIIALKVMESFQTAHAAIVQITFCYIAHLRTTTNKTSEPPKSKGQIENQSRFADQHGWRML
jgi:hypothetical protein